MNADTLEATAVFSEDNSNASTTVNLLKALEASYPEADKIYVLSNNTKYHFSSTVQGYIKASKINLLPLPLYLPELTLIGRFFKFFKKKVLYNRSYPTFNKCKQACLHFFKIQHTYQD